RVNRIDTDTSSDNENVENNKKDQKVGRKRSFNPGKWSRKAEKLKRYKRISTVRAIKRQQRPRNNIKGSKSQTFGYFIRLHGQEHTLMQPSKDTCAKCDYLIIKKQSTLEEEKNTAEVEQDEHLRNAEIARDSMANDRLRASDEMYVLILI
ncbi:hypothetical protein TNCT_684041, partial [Trichonephila clavata]